MYVCVCACCVYVYACVLRMQCVLHVYCVRTCVHVYVCVCYIRMCRCAQGLLYNKHLTVLKTALSV